MPIDEGGSAKSRMVSTTTGRVHLRDYGGLGTPVVLMHGFPDDSRIYDRLAPLLGSRRVIALDWLGYGGSDRLSAGDFDPADHLMELSAVVDFLDVSRVCLVAHDASGPDAIDFSLNDPNRVERLFLLNTYYGNAPMLRLPEMIRLLADPNFKPLADAIMDDPGQRLWLVAHTARQFGYDPGDQAGVGIASVLPQFFGGGDTSDALVAIRAWTRALFPELARQDVAILAGRLRALDVPVSIVFGGRDEYLNAGLASHLASLFVGADVNIVDDASHWPQWDQPEAVAQVISGS